MEGFAAYSLDAFVGALASKAPAPGGGGAAALVGAVGVALGGMVGSLTLGKKAHAEAQGEIGRLMEQARSLRLRLLALVDRDAEAFRPLARAYGMPSATPGQQEEKARAMEQALRASCEVPLAIMDGCCEALRLLEGFARLGAPIAISDAGCGAACCMAALQAARLNVLTNAKAMRDRGMAGDVARRAAALMEEGMARGGAVYGGVAERLS